MPSPAALTTPLQPPAFAPQRPRRRRPLCPAASWLPDAPELFLSTRRASVSLEELLPLLQAASTRDAAPDRVATALARSTVVVSAFAPGSPASPAFAPPVGLSWLVPRPPPRRLVGYARAASDGALVGTVCDVVVAPHLRRTGVGRRLLAALLSELGALGVGDVGSLVPPSVAPFFTACKFGPDSLGAIHMALPPRTPPAPTVLAQAALADRLRAALAQAAAEGPQEPRRRGMLVRAPLP